MVGFFKRMAHPPFAVPRNLLVLFKSSMSVVGNSVESILDLLLLIGNLQAHGSYCPCCACKLASLVEDTMSILVMSAITLNPMISLWLSL